jgi:hypothetical protein
MSFTSRLIELLDGSGTDAGSWARKTARRPENATAKKKLTVIAGEYFDGLETAAP